MGRASLPLAERNTLFLLSGLWRKTLLWYCTGLPTTLHHRIWQWELTNRKWRVVNQRNLLPEPFEIIRDTLLVLLP